MTSLRDGISRTPAGRAPLGRARAAGSTQAALAVPAAELEPQPPWHCPALPGPRGPESTAQSRLLCLAQLPLEIGHTAQAATPGVHLGSPGILVWELLGSCLPQLLLLSVPQMGRVAMLPC